MKWLYGLLGAALLVPGTMARPQNVSPWELDVTAVQFEDGSASEDGEFSDGSLQAKLGYRMRLGPQWMLGSNVSFGQRRFDFDNPLLFDDRLPAWDHRQQVGLGFNVIHLLNKEWSVIAAPRFQWAASDDASLGDGFSYGILAGGMRKFGDDLQLGLGVSYLNDVDETKVIPIILVRWQITDKLKLDNPFEPGFAGGAGLELSYRWNPHYELAFGGAYRGDRFAVSDGSVELQNPLAFLRVSYFPKASWDLSLLAGYRFDGDFEWQPDNGAKQEQELDGRLGVGVSFAFRF
ncbi:DUF6268 family outer membrane beta-barrel protein [Ferrimonas marina]|uniref:DUF6268 domain-containing protein n=1 Tax=Ferrimonas marina TaxID=299255 RepID=A0A1M5RQD0_9GAMM|nr:DUF6268 family outer membrane beta-barrel protein [Ferrimonas marina]SHH28380.1 hypothetical protein SAMN02745129_1705 [Ferrimonas marina]